MHRRTRPTRRELISEVFEFVEGFYNTTRRHSALSYLSPAQFETMTNININNENGYRRKPESVRRTGSTPLLCGGCNRRKGHAWLAVR